jgi:hypothetical protein
MFLSPAELAVVVAAVVSAVADFSPLLLHAVMKQINAAEEIVKNFFIVFLIFCLVNDWCGYDIEK